MRRWLMNPAFRIPDENSNDVGVNQTPYHRLTFFDLSAQSCERLQIGLQHVAEVQQKLEIALAIFVLFVVANANRAEYLPIGPNDWDAQVRDHPRLTMAVRSPRLVFESISGSQRSTGLQLRRAIRPGVDGARGARISFRRAGDQNFELRGLDSHDRGRRHVHDLGKQIADLLPFADD